VIKGKHLQVDFASSEVIRRFLERMSIGLPSNLENSSPGSHVVGSPLIGNSFGPCLKDTGFPGRKLRNKIDEDDMSYRYLIDCFCYLVYLTIVKDNINEIFEFLL